MNVNGVTVKQQRYDENCPVGDLKVHPNNPNIGDEQSIFESIETNNFYGAIIVQESTKHILVGNHRYKTMVDSGAPTIPTLFIDVNDVEATRIMLVDNRTAETATFDDTLLMQALGDLANTDLGFVGTGFNDADMTALSDEIQVPEGVTDIERGQRYFVTIGGVISKRITEERFNEWLDEVTTKIGSSDEEEIELEIRRRMGLV